MATKFSMTVSQKTGKGFLEISGGPLEGEPLVVRPSTPEGDTPQRMWMWFGTFGAVGDMLVADGRTYQMQPPIIGA